MRKFPFNNPLLLVPVPNYRYFGQLTRSYSGFLVFRNESFGWRAAVLFSVDVMSKCSTIQHFVSFFTPKQNLFFPSHDFQFFDNYRTYLRDFYQNFYRIFSVLHRESLPWDYACDNGSLDRFQLMNFVSLSYHSKYALDIIIVVLNQIMVWRTGMSNLSDSELFDLKIFLRNHPKYYLLKNVYSDLFASSKDLFD